MKNKILKKELSILRDHEPDCTETDQLELKQ